jgi:hypothetical protein
VDAVRSDKHKQPHAGGVPVKNASWFSIVAAAVAVLALLVSPAGAALSAPVAVTPADSALVDALPVFGWEKVAGAARYEWEIAADPGFNSPVLGFNWDHFFTRNTRATMWKVVPNGSYWWHVRAVTADGSVSPWSPARQFTKRWAKSPDLVAPTNGATVVFPREHFRLAWEPVDGAVKYLVSIATDPSLGTLVWSGAPITTQATAFTLAKPLAPDQTYYWGITPLDAAGNRGSASVVWSFRWEWPSTTTTRVDDIASEAEIYDHEFSWDPVPGAAGYELEVNTSSDFAPGSKIREIPVSTATGLTTIGTSYSPAVVLQNNRLYWRVRAVDAAKNTGVWNEGPTFVKSFDNALPSIRNLHLTVDPSPAAWPVETSTPAIEWDPVPGASSYDVEVTVYSDDGCQWTSPSEHWKSKTSTPAWTPLGWGWNNVKPYESDRPVAWDVPQMKAGHEYCVRVTALDRPSKFSEPYVRSAETYLPAENQPAFVWLGPDPGAPCTAPCSAGSLGAGDYLTPIGGVVERDMPLLRWKPIEGYESFFVLVARDQDFTSLVDFAFTRVPAYAPRVGFGPRTYPDETTEYYWAVLPARNPDGSGVTTAPRFSAPQSFHKQSLPPELLTADGTVFSGPAHFQWKAVTAARHYRLQVSTDPSFASCPALAGITATACPENSMTDSTAFTGTATYPADVNLYWRVRADAETVEDSNGVGLTWSPTRTFRQTLPAPVADPDNPPSGDAVPTWKWNPVPGAVSYDFELRFPDGNNATFTGIPSAAATATVLKGTGIWTWRVRANFPQVNATARTAGPWSAFQLFTRTIREPGSPTENVSPAHVVLQWNPKPNAFNYRVQVSTRADFTGVFDSQTTENTSWAPFLSAAPYTAGGTFYWRVAAADDAFLNVGDYTATRSFTLPASTSKAASRITASVAKTTRLIKVSGYVFPAHPAKAVTVTLYRKRSGVFRRVSVKRPLLSSLSRYATSFGRPSPGSCKVTARFGGDADHLPSAKTVFFRC